MKEYIECGKIVGTHGCRGSVKVEPWCDSPKVLANFDRVYFVTKEGTYYSHAVKGAFIHKSHVVMTIDAIEDMETAEFLKGTILYAHRDQIPLKKGAMLLCDIIGLPVKDATTGEVYGTVKDIDEAPASRLYVIDTPHGEVLLPDIPVFIKEVNPDQGLIVTPIPGFFHDV